MLGNGSRSTIWARIVLVCVGFCLIFGMCACASGQSSSKANEEVAESTQGEDSQTAPVEEEPIDEDQLVMKVSNASEFEVPLDEVTVTVYNSTLSNPTANAEAVENAIKRLKMMGIKHIIRKDTTSMDMNLVVYRASEYAQIAALISGDLGISGPLEIPNDGSDGWSYSTDIAVVIAKK